MEDKVPIAGIQIGGLVEGGAGSEALEPAYEGASEDSEEDGESTPGFTQAFKISTTVIPLVLTGVMVDFLPSRYTRWREASREAFTTWIQWQLIADVIQASDQWILDPGGTINRRKEEEDHHKSIVQKYEPHTNQPQKMTEKSKLVPAATMEREAGLRDQARENAKGIMVAVPSEAIQGSGGSCGMARPSRRRCGKELLEELGTAREKEAFIVNIAKVRGAMRARFLAVGVFLSVLAVSSKQVVDTMKKVWKLRGNLEFCPLEGRRFVLEFAEEGDFTHVTKGGPWRFRADTVLVEALKEGDDPATVTFTSVPIWVQLKDIPFYLLSKELARDLGKKIGSLITIDNNARGDIFDKILRARVRIDIDQPLMRWTPILDGVTNEEVIVSIFYERLPSFCLRCGIIGHGEGSCSIPANQQKRSYNKDLGVPPTLAEDEHHWFFPEYTGQARHQHSSTLPWHLPVAANPSVVDTSTRQQAIVAHITIEVGKLSVQDPNPVKKMNEELLKDDIGSPTASVASSQLPSKEAVEDAEEPAIIITLPPSKRKEW
ncbi:hypothetical protein ACQ4PT_056797 [Festuca glaucescens]